MVNPDHLIARMQVLIDCNGAQTPVYAGDSYLYQARIGKVKREVPAVKTDDGRFCPVH